MDLGLKGKSVIVTGAAQGIGRAAALRFAREETRLTLVDLNKAKLEETAAEVRALGAEVVEVQADIADEEDVSRMIKSAMNAYSRVDCAFNNAGICEAPKPLHEFTLTEFMQTHQVNVQGTFNCLRAEIEVMLETGGGSIVNTSSMLGLIGKQGFAPYVSSKHAIIGMTKTAAIDYAASGIRINAIAPGVCRTPLVQALVEDLGDDSIFTDLIPAKRLGEPDEIADMAVWLASERAAFVTGAVISADGGQSIS